MIRNTSFVALTLGLVAVGVSAQAQQIIDRFTTSQGPVIQVNPGTSPVSSLAIADVLGGARDIRVTNLTPNAGTVSVEVFGNIPGGTPPNNLGTLTYSSDIFTTGFAEVSYDGQADGVISTSGLGGGAGLDVTNGGTNTGFLGEFGSDNGAAFTITLFDDANSVAASRTIPAGGQSFPFDGFFIPFGEFAGVNLTSIDAVRLTINGQNDAGTDVGVRFLRFGRQEVVPEPGTYAMLAGAVAFGGLILRRRLVK